MTGPPPRRVRTDAPFLLLLAVIGGLYVVLIGAMLAADAWFLMRHPDSPPPLGWAERLAHHLAHTLASPEIRYAIRLSLVSCTLTALLSLWVAVPMGYLMSRYRFRGQWLLDALLDIPIVLPPLVIGLSLLILFQTPLGRAVEWVVPVTYAVPGVVLAQFAVACAFAVRTMRVTFDGLSPRHEQVALTLGCSRAQAFWKVVLPSARRGMVTAATLAWARALGEFGPILVFSGATRMRTEVLPTTVFLELSVGNLETAVAVSLLMVLAAVIVLVVVRVYGMGSFSRER
jgi:molybdate transport system permease protein